ncbi:protein-glutamate O-methyltransferase CheR [bacterium]|nr:protein-glutamate O-methyltransferase CheR [bacterium]
MIETPYIVTYPVSDAEFQLIQKLIYETAGVYIKSHKKTMVANRLRKRLEAHGFSRHKQYYDFITKTPEGRQELIEFINCLTTNETFFFRHGEQLDLLAEKIIPQLLSELKPSEKLRIWSAACSSGEEPYSIAILLHHKFRPDVLKRIEIVASDINIQVLEKAKQGDYKPYALQKVSPFFKGHYFEKKSEDKYHLIRPVKEMVQFFRHNLLESNHHGKFDIILCRNVMIYFDIESKKKTLGQIDLCLKKGGYLMTGYAESLFRIETTLKYIQPTLYFKE